MLATTPYQRQLSSVRYSESSISTAGATHLFSVVATDILLAAVPFWPMMPGTVSLLLSKRRQILMQNLSIKSLLFKHTDDRNTAVTTTSVKKTPLPLLLTLTLRIHSLTPSSKFYWRKQWRVLAFNNAFWHVHGSMKTQDIMTPVNFWNKPGLVCHRPGSSTHGVK